jgi:hypothetical protein
MGFNGTPFYLELKSNWWGANVTVAARVHTDWIEAVGFIPLVPTLDSGFHAVITFQLNYLSFWLRLRTYPWSTFDPTLKYLQLVP